MEAKFKIGDKVRKPKGYRFDAVIVSVFETLAGEIRVVAEVQNGNCCAMLHIFNEGQLEKNGE